MSHQIEDVICSFEHINGISFKSKDTGRLIYLIALPPKDNGTDILFFDQDNRPSGYIYDFQGLVVLTNKEGRKLFYKGNQLAEIKR